MDANILYPISAILLALVNIVYISSHLQANKVSDLFHAYLPKIDAHGKEITTGFTVADAGHALYVANINRIFPLVDRMPQAFQHIGYLIFRITADVLLALIPAFGLTYALINTNRQQFYFSIIIIFSLVSLLATLALLFTTLRYTITRATAHWRGSKTDSI